MISHAFVDIPKNAETHIQTSAPGPPLTIAVATPLIFPVPTVFASPVQAARKLDTVPTPSPAEEKKPAPPAAEKPASPVRETPAPAAPVSQEEKPDELDIDLLLEEIKRM